LQAMLNFKEAWYGYATQVNNVWVISLDFMPKILAALLALVIAIWVGRKLAKTLVALLVKTSLPGIYKGFFSIQSQGCLHCWESRHKYGLLVIGRYLAACLVSNCSDMECFTSYTFWFASQR